MERFSGMLMDTKLSDEARNQGSDQGIKVDVESRGSNDSKGWDPRLEPPHEDGNRQRLGSYLNDCRIKNANARVGQQSNPQLEQQVDTDRVRSKMIDRSELPKVELSKYDGSTADYWNFIKQFEMHVEDRTSDAGQRMLLLLNYCNGEAKEAIKGCAILPAIEGYPRARALLKRLFGRSHVISRNLIDEMLNFPRIRKYDEKALTRLYIKMSNCYTSLKQMKHFADIDAMTTLQGIVSKLPEDTCDRWIIKTHGIYEADREPCFEDLIRFVDVEASIAHSRFTEGRRTVERSSAHDTKYESKVDNR